MMDLSKLLRSAGIKYSVLESDPKITGIADDSRKVKRGSLFVAIPGLTVDAHQFIPQAIKDGVAAIVGEKEPVNLELGGATYIRVPDSREALGRLSSAWFGHPSKNMKVIGVTGTDGKTTTATLLHQILETAGKKVGSITTIGAHIGRKTYDTGFHVTSPDPLLLQRFLARMVKEGVEYAILEVTSHGLDQERFAGVKFDVGVLTNITHEHLDYHKTFEAYIEAKLKLFKDVKIAVLNKDDKSYDFIRMKLPKTVRVLPYSLSTQEGIRPVLPGKFNKYNALAASTTAQSLGVSSKIIQKALQSVKQIPGRLEKINTGKGFDVYIDFAHTPNALQNLLQTLIGFKEEKGHLIVVLGSAGERDMEKRALMGKVSVKLADVSIFTAEDPRSEDVNRIIDQMVEGVKNTNHSHEYFRVPERGEAIAFAIKNAKKGDIVAICGKGHERSLAYNHVEHPWSDKEFTKVVLAARKDNSAIVLAAGKGTRMKSEKPKVLHKIAGRPMISFTLENLRNSLFGTIIVVVGYKKDEVIKEIGPAVISAIQPKMLGNAHAVSCGLRKLDKKAKNVVIVQGDDSAFYSAKTLNLLMNKHKAAKATVTLATIRRKIPGKLGIIKRGKTGNIVGVEHWDGTGNPPKEGEINCGLWVFAKSWLAKSLSKIEKNEKGEYYLTDIIGIADKDNVTIQTVQIPGEEWFGINTPQELESANKKMVSILSTR